MHGWLLVVGLGVFIAVVLLGGQRFPRVKVPRHWSTVQRESTARPIPRVIYRTWKTRTVHPRVAQTVSDMMKLNPDYEHILFTDDEMHQFVHDHGDAHVVRAYDSLTHIVAQADMWRYLVLYIRGGVYIDMDSTIVCRLADLIRDDDVAVISRESNDCRFVQWALVFAAGHPILKRALELCVQNINEHPEEADIDNLTGPITFTRAIESVHRELGAPGSPPRGHTSVHGRDGQLIYRVMGADFEGYMKFKFKGHKTLYIESSHWKQFRGPLVQ